MERIDLLSKPLQGGLPIFITGRSKQQVEDCQQRWRRLTKRNDGVFKPSNQATYFDLAEDPRQLPRSIHQSISISQEPLLKLLEQWQGIGIDQLMFNFKQSRRPVADVLAEMSEYVLPHFPAGDRVDK